MAEENDEVKPHSPTDEPKKLTAALPKFESPNLPVLTDTFMKTCAN